jgi:GT2 family glycosyltransferase
MRSQLPRRFWRPQPPTAEPTLREIAVLVVAYRNPELLRMCLASIEEHLGEVDVHVWDNSASAESGIDEVVADYPRVNWYLGSANIGFAAGVNALACKVPGSDLLLVNPDAVLQGKVSGTLAALRKRGVAAAGPLTVDDSSRGRSRPWDVAHREKTLARALVSNSGYSHRFRGHRWSELYRTQPTAVDGYLTGACLAISRDAWDAIGPFDEEFFLYGEEDDWQRRARSAGWSLELIDEPGIAHTGHGTVANDAVAAMRSRDLLRVNVALNLELEKGGVTANLYLAGAALLDRVQRSARRDRAARRRPAGPLPSIVITMNRLTQGTRERERIRLARELDRRGHEVVIACTRRFGPLIAEIPTSIRVVRVPWWVPAVDIGAGRSIIISGETKSEIAFAALWKVSGLRRRWLRSKQGSALSAQTVETVGR